jgi:hypothetical protein
MANVIEIEVDHPQNHNWFFAPLGKPIRGRIDFLREKQTDYLKLRDDFPRGLPGQRLTIDLDAGQAVLTDPIHQDPNICAQIKKRGMGLPTEKETFEFDKALIPTWCYWIKRGVGSGMVKVLKGKLPEKIEGHIKRFQVNEAKDPNTTRTEKLLAILFAKLSPEERKAAQEMMNAN